MQQQDGQDSITLKERSSDPTLHDLPQAYRKPSRRRRIVLTILASLCVLLVVVYAGVSAYVADQLTRPIRRAVAGTPADLGMAFDRVSFTTADGILLQGWWMPAPGSSRAIVMVHGRNSTRSGNTGALIALAQGLEQAGYNVLSFDLRAHGESGGVRYSLGPFERWDLLAAVAQVEAHGIVPGKIGVWGRSLGAATTLLTAPDEKGIAAIVEDSSYARLSDVLDVELPKAAGLPAFFSPGILLGTTVLYGMHVEDAIPERAVPLIAPRPILFIHSESDTFIPLEHGRRLWRASGEGPDFLWTVPGPEHAGMFENDRAEYLRRITTFFDRSIK